MHLLDSFINSFIILILGNTKLSPFIQHLLITNFRITSDIFTILKYLKYKIIALFYTGRHLKWHS